MKSVRLFFPLLLTLILNLSLPVFASQNISLPENVSEVNIQKTGSIEIELTDGEEGTSKEGVIFHYSKVAEIVDGQYELVEQYKGIRKPSITVPWKNLALEIIILRKMDRLYHEKRLSSPLTMVKLTASYSMAKK